MEQDKMKKVFNFGPGPDSWAWVGGDMLSNQSRCFVLADFQGLGNFSGTFVGGKGPLDQIFLNF